MRVGGDVGVPARRIERRRSRLRVEASAGEVIERADLRVVYVSSDGDLATTSPQAAAGFIGKRAVRDISKGSLLTADVVSGGEQLAAGEGVVGVAVAVSAVPSSVLWRGGSVPVLRRILSLLGKLPEQLQLLRRGRLLSDADLRSVLSVLRRRLLQPAHAGLRVSWAARLTVLRYGWSPVLRRQRGAAQSVLAVSLAGGNYGSAPTLLARGRRRRRRRQRALFFGAVPAVVLHRRPTVLEPVLLVSVKE